MIPARLLPMLLRSGLGLAGAGDVVADEAEARGWNLASRSRVWELGTSEREWSLAGRSRDWALPVRPI